MKQNKINRENDGIDEVYFLESTWIGIGLHDSAHSIRFNAEQCRLNGDHERIQCGGDVDSALDEHIDA